MKLLSVPSLFGSAKNSYEEKKKKKKKKRAHSTSRTDTPSFGSAASSDDSTPQSVLPSGGLSWPSSSDLKISRRDLESALRRLSPGRPSDGDVAAIISDYASCLCAGVVEEEELRGAFAVFDADGDGRISAEELLAVFAALGEDECTLDDCRRMIDGVDTDGDGFVCFDDFARMMDGQR